MDNIHNLLRRQFKKYFDESFTIPQQWYDFINAVNDAYIQSDKDRSMLERSLDFSSEELLHKNQALNNTLSLLHATIESTTDGILVVDKEGKIVSFNNNFIRMWNIPQVIIDSRDDNKALHFVLGQLKNPDSFLKKVKELYEQPNAESYDLIKFKDGRIFERYSKPQKIAEKCVGRVWSFRDVTNQKKAERKIVSMAYFDVLTSLPNRYLLRDRLNQAITYAEKYKKLMAVIYLDLDNFKRINDTFGHNVGDQLLQGVADRLTKHVRNIDTLSRPVDDNSETTLARLGGDEFTVLLREINNIQDAGRVAQRIIHLLAEPFNITDRNLFISTSIGIALYPNDGQDADSLLKNADTAMYHAKESGKNNFQFFNESMNRAAFERFTLENSLRKAIDNNEFQIYYQPQFDLLSQEIIGVEALVRWMHPEKGMILPDTFIPIAEESGLILRLGDWILQKACKQNKIWHDAGNDSLSVTVNISGVQFRQKDFVESIAQALLDADLEPHYLELELTESILMQPSKTLVTTLNELKATGVRIAIDDFGTGYSSLGYLKKLPIDTLKIDRSFVRDIDLDIDNRAIVKAMITLARNLNMKIIAEGVETDMQLAYLQEQGSDGVQGFLLSKPLSVESLTDLLGKKYNLYSNGVSY